jgi:ferritin
MLTQKMQDALNVQINAEYYSSYLYLSMAAYCEEANFKGFANWFRVQGQEEMVHVMKFFEYVIDRKGRVELKAIEGPPVSWDSPLAAFEAAYKHEQHVTALINKLAGLAISENDHATHTLLQWFINEQVEEEANADAVVQQLKLAANTPAALFMLDRELGQRVFTPPPAAGQPGA